MFARTVKLYRESFTGLSKEVWLLSAVMLINRSGMMVLPFLSIYLTGQLDFTLTQAGITMACFGLGSVAGTYVGGQLTDKIGYYQVQFWSLITTGLFFLGLMFIKDFIGFSIGLFVLTFVGDMFRPASFTAIRAYSKPENRTRSLSLIRLAINLGMGAGPAVGGFLALNYGYQTLFIVDGVTCFLAAIFFRFSLKEKKVKEKKEALAPTGPTSGPWSDKVFVLFLVATLLMALIFMQLFYTTPLAFKEVFGLNESGIGLLFAINGFLIFLIEMPVVFILEKKIPVMKLIAIGMLLVAGSYLVLASPLTWIGLAVISILLITFGEIISFPFSSSFAVDRAPENLTGRYVGLYGMTFSVAHIIAPIIGMQMIRLFGYIPLYFLMGGIGLLATWIYWQVHLLSEKERFENPELEVPVPE
ncbi:MAG: MFS transporter [Bacteroidetes bacterium]|nr:MFS transporter [Bacteroidota bacterium]